MDQWQLLIILVLFIVLLVLIVWIFWPGLDKPAIVVTEPADTASIGEPCDIATLCDPRLVCETTCKGTLGVKCSGNYQCATNLYCVGIIVDEGVVLKQGLCQTRPNGNLDQPCPSCNDGYTCDMSLSPAICKANEGTECAINDDCYFRVCTAGVCSGGQIQADPCRTDNVPFVQGTIVSSSRCEGDLICDTTDVTQSGSETVDGYCQLPQITNGSEGAFCLAGEPFPQPNNMLPPGCKTGLVCLNGTCAVSRQLWGETCDINPATADPLSTCIPPLVCGIGPGGVTETVCVYPEDPNSCDLTGDCTEGYQCKNRQCLTTTAFCTVNSDCLTGVCDTDVTKIWRWSGNSKIDPTTAGWKEHSVLSTGVVFTTFDASDTKLWGVSVQDTPMPSLGLSLFVNATNIVSSTMGGIYEYLLPETTLDHPQWLKVFPHQVVETIVIGGDSVTRTTTIKNLTAPSDVLIYEGAPLIVANVKLVFPDSSIIQNDALYLLRKLPQSPINGTVPEDQCFAAALTMNHILEPFNVTPGDLILGTQHTVVPMIGEELITEITDLDVSEQQSIILHGSSSSAPNYLFLRTDQIVNYFLREQGVAVPRFYKSARGCDEFNYSFIKTIAGNQQIVFNGVLTGQILPHPTLTLTTRTYNLHDYQHFNVNSHEFVNSQSTIMIAESNNISDNPINVVMVEGLLQTFVPGYVAESNRVTTAIHGQYLMASGICS